jgi:nucleotide-binding universal stress UspA family protein
VVEPILPFADTTVAAADVESLTTITHESREVSLRAQRDRTHPGTRDWPFVIDTGDRIERIVESADASGASLIILGLGAHGVTARLLGRETAVRVMRAARTPVLAVPREAPGAATRGRDRIRVTAR